MSISQNDRAQKRPIVALLKVVFPALAAVTVLLFSMLCIFSFEGASGYFKSTPLATVTYVFMILTVIAGAASPFVIGKGATLTTARSMTAKVFSCIPGILALYTALNIASAEGNRLIVLISITALFPIFFSRVKRIPIALRLSAGFLQAIFAILAIAYLYFDLSVELNSPVKLTLMLAAAGVILSTLGELRQALGANSPGYYYCARLLSFTFSSCGAVLGCVACAVTPERFSGLYLSLPIFFAGYAIYSAYDLITLTVSQNDGTI